MEMAAAPVPKPEAPEPAAPEAGRPGTGRSSRLSVWDPAAVLMILLAYFTRLLVAEGRDLLQLSFFVMAGALVLAAVISLVLIALRPQTLRPTVLTILTGAVLYMESGFPLPPDFGNWLAAQGGPFLVLVVRLVAYVLPIAVFYWLARERLSLILTLLFGAIAVAGLVLG